MQKKSQITSTKRMQSEWIEMWDVGVDFTKYRLQAWHILFLNGFLCPPVVQSTQILAKSTSNYNSELRV